MDISHILEHLDRYRRHALLKDQVYIALFLCPMSIMKDNVPTKGIYRSLRDTLPRKGLL